MLRTWIIMGLLTPLFCFSQNFDKEIKDKKCAMPRSVPEVEAQALAAESCCCEFTYVFQSTGHPTLMGRYRITPTDSLYINDQTAGGQNLDTLWQQIANYEGSLVNFTLIINPGVFAILTIVPGSEQDMGTWWRFKIESIERSTPFFTNGAKSCFSWSYGGPSSDGFIPITGTTVGNYLSGTIECDPTGLIFAEQNSPSGIYSRTVVSDGIYDISSDAAYFSQTSTAPDKCEMYTEDLVTGAKALVFTQAATVTIQTDSPTENAMFVVTPSGGLFASTDTTSSGIEYSGIDLDNLDPNSLVPKSYVDVWQGNGVPSILADHIGRMYLDQTNVKVYIAFGTMFLSEWKLLN